MNRYSFTQAVDADAAVREKSGPAVKFIAGGTNLVDLMKYNVERPERLVDINRLALREIADAPGGGLRIGALVTNSTCAYDEQIGRRYPLLRNTILSGASPQLRNAATTGGNLLQRTRCYYFRDGVSACNKREAGAGCAAQDGLTREMALFGGSEKCIATYNGDWGNTLAAFDTAIPITSPARARTIPLQELLVPYGEDPARETTLRPGEIITAILVQATPMGRRSTYLKVRDRQSYAYAVVSAAVALDMDGGTVRDARVALGGVATTPWRSLAAEAALKGVTLTDETVLKAGQAAFAEAQPRGENAFKIDLGARAVARAAMVASKRN